MDNAPVTVGLDRLGGRDLPQVGGKAANLGELLRAGFAVPDGFCVMTPAYAAAARAADLDAVLAASDPDRLGGRARAALLAVPIPAAVAAAVIDAYAALGAHVPVAVRSSATAEDLPTASFAGQQDTFLNVVGRDAVLDAVRRCWASLWTDRAVQYRARAGIDQHGVALAVVVQRMLDVEVAGVLFTADPVTGRRDRTVIDANPGLGEAVVSGAVNPDHVEVEADGRISEVRVGDKALAVRALAGGGVEHVAAASDAEPCLSEAAITELAAVGRRVAARFGAPQDLEWAIDTEGAVWLTQSRPITTLYPLPRSPEPGLRVFVCASLAQGLTRPVTPMGISAFRVVASTASRVVFGVPVPDTLAGPPVFAEAGGRMFIDATGVLRSRVGRLLVPRVLDVMEARSAVVLRALFDEPELAVRSTSVLPFARGLAGALLRYRVPPTVAVSVASPAAGRRRAARVARRVRAHVPAGPDATGAERLDAAVRVLGAAFATVPRVAPVAGAGFLMLALARRLAGPDLDADTVHDVLRSLPYNVTTGMDLRLWDVATRLRADLPSASALREHSAAELTAAHRDGTLPPVLRDELGGFLREHGHRAVAEIDLGVPRWSDDPSYLFGVLANYLRVEDPEHGADVVFARGARAADDAVAAAAARVRRRGGGWAGRGRALLVGTALRRMRELAGMREEHKDLLVRMLAQARTEIAAVGAELAARGLLDAAEDVFLLDLAMARTALAGVDHRAVVAVRRAEYEREMLRRHVPRVLLSDGTEPETLAAADPGDTPGALRGSPASAGTVSAPARVVLDPVGAHLEPGEVLVCPSTDPGWTPLFLTAGGLVMEMGGSNSHGAVVAREYGIPAVVGVPGATECIVTGQRVAVDGAAGLVRPSPEESGAPTGETR
ncbi:MAG: phosphoenolpyruvate synthase [Pseudonocardia sp.]|nr:phosphoenolpyruvate synthase [Pseudonocardia sp.]